jgi:hypothetical protein
MSQVTTIKEVALQAIEENLIAAKTCIDKRKPNGGILGYPAALLLLCTTDAIGNGLLPPIPRRYTRLDVLQHPPFDHLGLTDKQVCNLTQWYRNSLAHAATMALGRFLTSKATGEPFDFDPNGALTYIHVPVFYEVVRAAWGKVDKDRFNPPSSPPPRCRRSP